MRKKTVKRALELRELRKLREFKHYAQPIIDLLIKEQLEMRPDNNVRSDTPLRSLLRDFERSQCR